MPDSSSRTSLRGAHGPPAAGPTSADLFRIFDLLLLRRLDVFRLRTFGPLAFGEGHFLALAKLVKTDADELRGVKKQILGRTGVNETETLVSQLFDRSFSHRFSPVNLE